MSEKPNLQSDRAELPPVPGVELVTSHSSPVTFRVLSEDEHADARHIFEEHGGTLPPPELSMIVVGEDEAGEVVFMCAPCSVVLVEHLYVAPKHRASGLWRAGCDAVVRELRERGVGGFLSLVPDERMAHMARASGMQELPFRVFQKEL